MTEVASKARTGVGEPTMGGGKAWWIWALGVTFVVFLFSFQTGYSASNMRVQKDLGRM
jgi:hypothetical protein